MSWSNSSKSSTTFTPESKSSTSYSTQNKSGGAWLYEETDLTYEMPLLFFERWGTEYITWANQTKS